MSKGKNESKTDEQEAGASRKENNKVSSEDDTNDTYAPLNSTSSSTTVPTDEVWDVVRVFQYPSACDCRTPECENKAVVPPTNGPCAKNAKRRTLEVGLNILPLLPNTSSPMPTTKAARNRHASSTTVGGTPSLPDTSKIARRG
jgi:hypothetical protein